MYKQSLYGIRLKNVLEVYDTGKRHEQSGVRFLGFRDVSLVPFDNKLIDRSALGPQEVHISIEIYLSNVHIIWKMISHINLLSYIPLQIKWLNEYNARIRTMVGEELKVQYNMQTFYWMINNTMHVKEYFTESEYRALRSQSHFIHFGQWTCIFAVIITLLLA